MCNLKLGFTCCWRGLQCGYRHCYIAMGPAQRIAGLSVYAELYIYSLLIYGVDMSLKISRYQYIATISFNFYLQTTVTLVYSCRYEQFFVCIISTNCLVQMLLIYIGGHR